MTQYDTESMKKFLLTWSAVYVEGYLRVTSGRAISGRNTSVSRNVYEIELVN